MNVLIIEDDRKIVSFIRKGLEEQGFTVSVCRDGNDGCEMAAGRAWDAIVLDMGGLEG